MEITEFYNRYNYPNPSIYGKAFSTKVPQYTAHNIVANEGRIAVVGSGTCQAIIVGKANPKASVLAMDVSKTSIAISKSIGRHFGVSNVSHVVCDFHDVHLNQNSFDYVVMTGVLHHMHNRDEAVHKVYNITKQGGLFVGMVYSDKRPKYIRELNEHFLQNRYSVDQVEDHLKRTRNKWYADFTKNKQEIADTWLNPQFSEYSKEELIHALSSNGFTNIQVCLAGSYDNMWLWTCEKPD